MKIDNDAEGINKGSKTNLDSSKTTIDDLTLEINEKNKIITQTKSYLFDLERENDYLEREFKNISCEVSYYKGNKLIKLSKIFDYIYLLFKSNGELNLSIKLYKSLKNFSLFNVGEYLKNLEENSENNLNYISPYAHYVCVGFEKGYSFNNMDIGTYDTKKELLDLIIKEENEDKLEK